VTIRPDTPELPDGQHPSCDDQSLTNDEPCDERHALTRLADRIVTSWANTTRLLVVLTVLIVLLTAALWLLPVDVRIGPFQIIRR
jgi:hypothetical protein